MQNLINILNIFILQWFFVRIQDGIQMKHKNRGCFDFQHRFELTGFVLPLTGWYNQYFTIGKRWVIGLTKWR